MSVKQPPPKKNNNPRSKFKLNTAQRPVRLHANSPSSPELAPEPSRSRMMSLLAVLVAAGGSGQARVLRSQAPYMQVRHHPPLSHSPPDVDGSIVGLNWGLRLSTGGSVGVPWVSPPLG